MSYGQPFLGFQEHHIRGQNPEVFEQLIPYDINDAHCEVICPEHGHDQEPRCLMFPRANDSKWCSNFYPG